MSIATYDKYPWIANLYYAVDEDLNLFFLSDPDTVHCKQIAKNPKVTCAIYDSNQTPVKTKGKFDKIGMQYYGEAKIITNWIEAGKALFKWKNVLKIKTDEVFSIKNMKKAILHGRMYRVTPKKIKLFKQDKDGNDKEEVLEF